MNQRDDDDLHVLFSEARRLESGRAPTFGRVLARRPRSSSPRRWILPTTVAIATALTVIVVSRRGKSTEVPSIVRMAPGELRMPTDFLLDGDGSRLHQAVPEIGRSGDWLSSMRETTGS